MARIRSGDVRVHGLAQLNRALRAIGPDARKELKAASQEAAEMVATGARAAALSIGGVAAHVAPSIKPVASMSGSAGVAIGGSTYPMAGGAEFGSIRFKQFKPWRGSSSDAGYFLYPTIRRDADRVVENYVDHLDGIIKRRFPE